MVVEGGVQSAADHRAGAGAAAGGDGIGQNFPAPRAELTAPLRSRCPTMIGALSGVDTMPSNALSPLILLYP